MKIKYYILLIILSFGNNFLFAQHENDNWRFGNNNWKFDNSTPNGFTHTTNLNPYIRYVSSVISDKNTGALLFYSDGYKIYNKNGLVMTNGDNLFGINNTAFNTFGNPSDQSSIIVPLPNSSSIYYVFYINGNRKVDDQGNNSDTNSYNYGLRYAIVDMTLSGGLGAVTSKNNILFSSSPTNALTSTGASNGNSYWIVTANNGNFLSYKLNASGLSTTPITSPAPNYGNSFKISPNSMKLVTRVNTNPNKGIYLYDFNNTNGTITNQQNIINFNNHIQTQYVDHSDFKNTIEFSANSEIIYFTSWDGCLCTNPAAMSSFHKYRIYDNHFEGVGGSGTYGRSFSLQRAENGEIYIISAHTSYPTSGIKEVRFGYYNPSNVHQSYEWRIISNPNNFYSSVTEINPQLTNTKNGYSFPQLVPHLDTNTCPNIFTIDQPVTLSQNFQAGQSIIASSAINDDLTINYKAGQNVNLLPGFYVKATRGSLFHAYIGPCDDGEIIGRNGNLSKNITQKDNSITLSSSEIKIYPNPTSNYINVDPGNEKLISWELYDLSGKNILKGSSKQVNVQSLPKASYLIKIKTDKKQVTKKVIVK